MPRIPDSYYVSTVSIEETDESPEMFFQSLGLTGLEGGLEGWGFLKKVWRGVKKVVRGGKKLFRKLKIKKLLKVAVPIVGAIGIPFLGPLAGAAVGRLAAKFGPQVAGLVKGGFTKPALVRTTKGVFTALVDSAEHRRIMERTGQRADGVISLADWKSLIGAKLGERHIPGAKVKKGKVEIPVYNNPVQVSASDSVTPPPAITSPAVPGQSQNWIVPVAILGAAMLLRK